MYVDPNNTLCVYDLELVNQVSVKNWMQTLKF